MIQGIEGYTVYDVRDVNVSTLNKVDDKVIDEAIVASIKRVILKGCSVINTTEFNSLKSKGFYISKLIWTCKKDKGVNDDLFEFEAEFGNQEKCTDFKYSCNGYYSFDTETLQHQSQKSKIYNSKENELLSLLEKSAENAFNKTLQ